MSELGDRAASASADSSEVFARMAALVYAPNALEEIHREICRAAPLVISGVDHASLMLRDGDRFYTAAASDEIALEIDRAELELDDGPCVDALREEAAQVNPDIRERSDWPELASWILEHTPVRGTMAFRLVLDDRKVGALNLFSDTPGVLGRSVDQAAVFAAFAGVTASAAHHNEQATTLRAGLDSNREIGKAVGLLMAFHKVNDQEAFAMLRQTSQDLNIKLAEVARELIEYHRDR